MSNPLEVRVGYNGQAAESGVQQLGTVLEQLKGVLGEHQKQMQFITKNMQDMAAESQRASMRMAEGWKTNSTLLGKFLAETRDGITSFKAWTDTISSAFGKMQSFMQIFREGAELAEAKQVFQATAASYGLFAETVIEASRKASDAQVSDINLIRENTRAMQLGVASDAKTISQLWEISVAKSDQFGERIPETFNKIVSAIGKGNGRILIELGLLPDAFGRASSKADLLSKRTDLLKTVLAQGAEEVKRLSGVGTTAADAFGRTDAAIENFKGSFANLATSMTPAINLFATLVGLASKFITLSGEALKIAVTGDWSTLKANPYVDFIKDQQAKGKSLEEIISSLKEKREQLISNYENELTARKNIRTGRDASQSFRSANGSTLPQTLTNLEPGLAAAHTQNMALINQAKQLAERLQGAKTEGDKFRVTVEGLSDAAGGAAGKTAKHKEAVESLSKAMREAFESAQEYAQANDAERFKIVMAELAKQAEAFADALGISKLQPIRNMLIELAGAASELSVNLQNAGDGLTTQAQRTVSGASDWFLGDVVGERYAEKLKNAGKSWLQATKPKSAMESMFGDLESIATKLYDAFSEPSGDAKDSKDKFEDSFKDSVSSSFEAGLNEAILNGGSFFEAFGNALKRQMVSALAQSITSSIFRTSGGAAQGYTGASGTLYSFASNAIGQFFGGGNKTNTANSSSSSNLGIFGSLFKGGNMLSNIGTGLAVGYAVDKLFGQGGLFGGRVVHGAKAINQAADINERVRQAADQRSQYLGMTGVSDETYNDLRRIQFWNAGYTSSKSGDGIFSKKTTTYALDAAKANEALDRYSKLIAKATAESAAREYEKQFAAIKSPAEALAMTVEDLKEVIKRGTDANGTLGESAKSAQLQLLQIQAAQKSCANARAGDWFSFMLQNPLALGSNTYDPFSSFWGEPAESISSFGTRQYKSPATFEPETQLTLGGNTLQGTDISTWLDQMSMTGGLKEQYAKAFNLQSMALDPKQQSAYLTARADMLKEQMATAESLSEIAEKKIGDLTLTTEDRTAAFQQFQEAQQSYYAAKLEALTIEQQQQAQIKAKQDALKNDRIADALTFLGEMRERGGQQVLVLAGGSPDTLARLKQIRDGTDSEGAAVIQQIIDGISGSSNPALRL